MGTKQKSNGARKDCLHLPRPPRRRLGGDGGAGTRKRRLPPRQPRVRQPLGRGRRDSVGEAAGTGRRGGGGFLSTAGSFTLSSGGNASGGQEEEELGQGMGRRGGGGFLSTQGSFSLSSGGNASGGQEEEDF